MKFTYAVITAIREKLAAGEKADVLVLPVPVLDGLAKDGKVRADARAMFGTLGVSVVVKEGAAKPDISTMEKFKAAMLAAKSVVHATPGQTPSGTHMGKVMEQLGIADAMAKKVIHKPALDGGVQLVASGEAEIGIYPASEVAGIKGISIVGPLPAGIDLTIVYGAGGDDRQCSAGRGGGLREIHGGAGKPRGVERGRLRAAALTGMAVTITSIAGGAPKPVFDRLGPLFERRTGHKLNALYDTMSGIAARVAAHEALDVLLMPVATDRDLCAGKAVVPAGLRAARQYRARGRRHGRRHGSRCLDAGGAARRAHGRRPCRARAADRHAERRAERQGDQAAWLGGPTLPAA